MDKSREIGAHHRNPKDTERMAAESIDVSRLEGVTLDVLYAHPGGLTAQEISEISGVYLYSIAPRLTRLTEKGMVEDSGMRRMGLRGRYCVVWKLATKGRLKKTAEAQGVLL